VGARRADELGAEARLLGDDELHRNSLHCHAHGPRGLALHDGDDLRKLGKSLESRRRRRHDDEVIRDVGPATGIAGGDAVELRGERLEEVAGAIQGHAAPRARLCLALERLAQLRRRLRPHSRDVLEPPALDSVAELRRRACVERAPDRDGPLRREPEEPPEADELRLDLRLELARVGDLPGLHELAQPSLEARPDATKLSHPSGAHELGDGSRERPDQLRCTAVRAHDVVRGAREVEQRRVALECIGDGPVVGV